MPLALPLPSHSCARAPPCVSRLSTICADGASRSTFACLQEDQEWYLHSLIEKGITSEDNNEATLLCILEEDYKKIKHRDKVMPCKRQRLPPARHRRPPLRYSVAARRLPRRRLATRFYTTRCSADQAMN